MITNIQRFSLHDGPGIRTTIFFKGCLLHCPWCCNPENVKPVLQTYTKNAIERVYGKYKSWEEIYTEIIKDRVYYTPEGGVTYSGGEPLLQASNLIPLFERLRSENIHQCIETSLACPSNCLKNTLPYIDLYYVDVKILSVAQASEVIGLNLKLYMQNIDMLFREKKTVIFRIPYILGYTNSEQNRYLIKNFINQYRPHSVEILKGHNLGASKYQSLKIAYQDIPTPSDEELNGFAEEINGTGVPVRICKI